MLGLILSVRGEFPMIEVVPPSGGLALRGDQTADLIPVLACKTGQRAG